MQLSRKIALLSGLVAMLAVTACASTGSGDGYRSDLLTREEIMSVEARNLYDVVRRLRPQWLQVRSRGERSFGGVPTEILVYQNQTQLGDVQELNRLSPSFAYQMKWLDGATASASLPGIGSRHVLGAIIISTAPPEPDTTGGG